MPWGIMAGFFGVQLATMGIIIFLLKKNLDRELICCALEHFAVLQPFPSSEITIESYKPLVEPVKMQLKAIASRKFSQSTIDFQVNPSLKGGVVIRLSGTAIDCSLAGRLKNLWARA